MFQIIIILCLVVSIEIFYQRCYVSRVSKSKENDNGRYFEYLIAKRLVESYKVLLTDRAKDDQLRDAKKNIDAKTKKNMINSLDKICSWIASKINLNEQTTLDRLPDIGNKRKTHDDISLTTENGENLSFSLKHNSTSIFHGRPWTVCNWIGIDADHAIFKEFKNNKDNIIETLHSHIPPGKTFSKNRKIMEIYSDYWSCFVQSIFNEMKTVLLYANSDNKLVLNFFNKIIGDGENQYRIILKKNSLIIEDLDNLVKPKIMNVSIKQKIRENDIRTNYVWYLCIHFDNGLKIEARSKQDSSKMKKVPPIKPDWQVVDWGKSGMIEEKL